MGFNMAYAGKGKPIHYMILLAIMIGVPAAVILFG